VALCVKKFAKIAIVNYNFQRKIHPKRRNQKKPRNLISSSSHAQCVIVEEESQGKLKLALDCEER
jgi:hypothetical protein